MQKQPPSSFCAVAAIAAALALGSTAASAQDAGPAPDVPTIAPPAPPAPSPNAAAPARAAQISAPVVQAVPAASAPEPAAATAPKAQSAAIRPVARTVTRTQATRTVTPTAAAAPAASVAVAVPAAVVAPPAAEPAPVIPLNPAPKAETAPVAQAQPASNGLSGGEAGLMALLAAGGLAGAGLMVARSRRKRDDEDEIAEAVTQGTATQGTAPGRTAFAPAMPVATLERAAPKRPEPATERFATPASQVPTGTEREALLQQMVAAEPDEANPFTSPRSRRKRACLILQHHAHLQQTQGAEPFDWRTYRSTEAPPRVNDTVSA